MTIAMTVTNFQHNKCLNYETSIQWPYYVHNLYRVCLSVFFYQNTALLRGVYMKFCSSGVCRAMFVILLCLKIPNDGTQSAKRLRIFQYVSMYAHKLDTFYWYEFPGSVSKELLWCMNGSIWVRLYYVFAVKPLTQPVLVV